MGGKSRLTLVALNPAVQLNLWQSQQPLSFHEVFMWKPLLPNHQAVIAEGIKILNTSHEAASFLAKPVYVAQFDKTLAFYVMEWDEKQCLFCDVIDEGHILFKQDRANQRFKRPLGFIGAPVLEATEIP